MILNTMLVRRVSIIFFIAFIYFSVGSARTRLIFKVSQSFIDKHVMVDPRNVYDIPYRHTKKEFDAVQYTVYNFRIPGRTQHSFLVMLNLQEPLDALEREYEIRNNGRVARHGDFRRYRIELDELPMIDIIHLEIKHMYSPTDQWYQIQRCFYSNDERTSFVLGAKVHAHVTKNGMDYIFEINHLDTVVLFNEQPCKVIWVYHGGRCKM